MRRKAGILLHISSLSGPYPIGDFGSKAYEFVNWLKNAGFTLWQILPLLPPDDTGSPYASHSAFGISHLFISPEILVEEKLLPETDLPVKSIYRKTDYQTASDFKKDLVNKSYNYFVERSNPELNEEFRKFCKTNWYWLDEHAFFVSVKELFDKKPWFEWPEEIKGRKPEALSHIADELKESIVKEKYSQWLSARQWQRLRAYANNNGVEIIGDIPFFVRHDSVDVWAHQKSYLLDEEGVPSVVAGVPPDYFSKKGQRWGNPMYNWEVLKAKGFRWWIGRILYYTSLFNALRIDHFRGYESLWHVPAEAENGTTGQWVKSPGRELLTTIKKVTINTQLIAEDLGYITEEVRDLRMAFQIPGTRVILFGFGGDDNNPSLPHNFSYDSVGYTGTHDTDTARGWVDSVEEKKRKKALEYTKSTPEKFSESIIQLGIESKADWFIVPMQDILNLPNEARMNTPATPRGNWQWRLDEDSLKKDICTDCFRLMQKTSRI